jgi:hypothetical protein
MNRFVEVPALVLGLLSALGTSSMAVDLPPSIALAIDKPACDDAAGLAEAITAVLAANPGLGADVATAATRRCPDDAAVIATAAVNADPNAAAVIVDAVLAALPDKDKEMLTGAILPLAGLQPPLPPGPGRYPDAPLIAPWTDPPKGPRFAGPGNGQSSSPF